MSKIYSGIMGLVVGDALGVPVEFNRRDSFHVTDMIGYGTYDLPPGTWSDDSSMTLATVESIARLGHISTDEMTSCRTFTAGLMKMRLLPTGNCLI